MKSIQLIQAKNYPELIAYIESNSFGDQLITFRHELKNGDVREVKIMNSEGSWAPTDPKSLMKLWKLERK